MTRFCLSCCCIDTWMNHFFWLILIGEADTGAGANGPAGTEADSRGGYTLEQHIPYAPTCSWPQGTCRSSFGRWGTDVAPLSSEHHEIIAECLKCYTHLMMPQLSCQRRRECLDQKSFPFYALLLETARLPPHHNCTHQKLLSLWLKVMDTF